MKKINYNSSLTTDIKTVKKKGKIWDIILIRLINGLAAIGCSFLVILGLYEFTSVVLSLGASLTTLVVLNSFSTIRVMIEDIKKRNSQVDEAEYYINNLVSSLNSENKNAINLVPEITFEGILDAITTKEENETKEYIPNTLQDRSHIKEEKITTTNFFLLDTDNKLRILREIRKEIKDNKNVEVNTDLYLLDEDNIPSYVPVVKVLERK